MVTVVRDDQLRALRALRRQRRPQRGVLRTRHLTNGPFHRVRPTLMTAEPTRPTLLQSIMRQLHVAARNNRVHSATADSPAAHCGRRRRTPQQASRLTEVRQGETMPNRDASTHWEGDLQNGSGNVTLDSSNTGQFAVSFPTRSSDNPSGQTSPEELIAAAHSSCLAMN